MNISKLKSNLLLRFYFPDKPCIYPVIRLLKLYGFWRRNRSVSKTIFVVFYLLFCNIFLASVCVKLILHFNYYLLMEFVQNSPYYLSVYALNTMFFQHKQWEELINMIIDNEVNSSNVRYSPHIAIIHKYNNYSQFIIYGYYIIFVPVLLFFFLSFWINNVFLKGEDEPFFSTYYALMPFDQEVHYFWSAFIQTVFGLSISIGMWIWETFLLSCSMFFIGQLKSLRVRCRSAIVENNESRSYKNIIACHKQYVDILRCVTNMYIHIFSCIYHTGQQN